MRFATPPRRPRAEPTVPMINVVFLLLIFFLISAQIAPPDPFDVTLPQAAAEDAPEAGPVLLLSADGRVALAGHTRADVWGALAALPEGGPLTLRADAGLAGVDLARVLARLAGLRRGSVDLVVQP